MTKYRLSVSRNQVEPGRWAPWLNPFPHPQHTAMPHQWPWWWLNDVRDTRSYSNLMWTSCTYRVPFSWNCTKPIYYGRGTSPVNDRCPQWATAEPQPSLTFWRSSFQFKPNLLPCRLRIRNHVLNYPFNLTWTTSPAASMNLYSHPLFTSNNYNPTKVCFAIFFLLVHEC